MKGFVSEGRMASAPPIPWDRPPTKSEVWAYITHIYEGLMTPDEMKERARRDWAGNYKYWVNIKGWRKQPDWEPGQPVIEAACPAGVFFHDTHYMTEIERLWRVAREQLAITSQLTLEAA